MLIDFFTGAGGIPIGAIVLIGVIVLLCTLIRHLPAIIWSLRCPRSSPHYRCPRTFSEEPSASGLLEGSIR
jgi:hypothetical protein